MSNLLQSMNFGVGTSSPGTFEFDGLAAGVNYDVTVTLGDTYAANATVTLPTGYGTVVSGAANVTNVSTAAGVYVHRTFTVTPNASGRLQLQFSTTSSSTMWAVDGIEVRPTVAGGTLTAPSGMLGGDGATVDTFSQTGLTPGDVYTISTTLGSVVTSDADSRYAGTQVIVGGAGTLTFQVRRPSGAGTATVTAQQVEGKAWASATVSYSTPASVSLASSKGSDTYGDSVTFTATVTGANGVTPGGRVELYVNGKDTQQSAAVSGSGSTATAAFTLSNLSAGTHAVTVVYSGDGINYPSGTSNAVTQTVGKKTLTVTATGVNRSYDGTTTATVTLSDNRVSGDQLTESYTSASFANKDAGNGIAVNVTGISVTGSAAGNYVLGNTTGTTTANIIPAAVSYTIGNDSQTYGTAANLSKDLPGTIATGVNGENLSIAYVSTGDTGTAHAGTYAITGSVTGGTGLASDYTVSLTSGTLTVNPAALSYTIGSDSQSYGNPANLSKDLPGTIATGINGENLSIAYSSTGDTATAQLRRVRHHGGGVGRDGKGVGLRGEPDERDVDGERGGIRLWDQRVGGAEWVCGGVADDDLHGIARLRVAGGGAGTGPWDAERDDDERSLGEHELRHVAGDLRGGRLDARGQLRRDGDAGRHLRGQRDGDGAQWVWECGWRRRQPEQREHGGRPIHGSHGHGHAQRRGEVATGVQYDGSHVGGGCTLCAADGDGRDAERAEWVVDRGWDERQHVQRERVDARGRVHGLDHAGERDHGGCGQPLRGDAGDRQQQRDAELPGAASVIGGHGHGDGAGGGGQGVGHDGGHLPVIRTRDRWTGLGQFLRGGRSHALRSSGRATHS